MMKRDAFSNVSFKAVGYRALIYGGALFLLAVIEGTVFTRFTLFGASPDLLLGAVLTLAMAEGEKTGGVCGIAAGFFGASLCGASALYMPFAFLVGYIFGIISDRALAKNYPSALALMGCVYALKCFFNLIDASVTAHSFDLLRSLTEAVLPELFYSAILFSPVYFIFRWLSAVFSRHGSPVKERKHNEFR